MSAAFMAIYTDDAAIVFRRALVSVVAVDCTVSVVVYAGRVSLVVTAVLRYSGLAKPGCKVTAAPQST
ncbi:MAG: hypothetical protein ABL898_12555 [Hyphomicrobiaceae bacterium]|nr:hypothetical protein [Hyphomicrobiaceae bacterium]